MAKPMTPDQWLAALRAEGVTDIVEIPGWRTNNRDHIKAFTDVHATMIHHTAGEGSGLPSLVFNGTSSLPGPLCHDYLTRTGRLYLVGNGRANHAGTVARNAYNAVLNEQAVHPYPDVDESIDGNAVSYGLECENSGAVDREWTPKQYDVAVRVQAARCRFHGWSANSVWAHKEATRRKPVDPRLDMDDFRDAVAARLAHTPDWNPNEEDDVALTVDDIKLLATKDGIWPAPKDATNYSDDPNSPDHYWSLGAHITGTTIKVRRIEKAVVALGQKVDALPAVELTDTQIATLAAAVAANPALAELIAEKVAVKLAERLAE
jgi:hypothetical protein